MPAPADSFIVDFLRAEGGVSSAALELARGRARKNGRGDPLPLALDLVAQKTLSLERYLQVLRASIERSAPCRSCGSARYVWQESVRAAPCPTCENPEPPRLASGSDLGPVAPEGLVFEDYTIERELGRGGMGVVFRALYRPAQRHEALKVLLPRADAQDRIARFHRERALLARVAHPAVIAIHRAGEHGGLEFLAMELIPGGRTLRSLMEQHGPRGVPIELACRIAAEAARGVGAAHEAGVLHRDLKPDNVLLDERDGAHVADFGLARALEDSDALTQSGSVVGTPLYMPLEQLQGKRDLDARADVYALSALLYELLAGEHPHVGTATFHALLDRVQRNQAPPLREKRHDATPALEALLARGLAARREERPETARELAREIEEALRCPTVRTIARLTSWKRSITPRAVALSLVALVLALFVGAVALWIVASGPGQAELERQALAWSGARLVAARSLEDAIANAERIAREEGRGATAELDAAASAHETALASIGPPPEGAQLPREEELDRAELALARARVLATALNAKDAAALTGALELLDRLVGRDGLPEVRKRLLLDLGRPPAAATPARAPRASDRETLELLASSASKPEKPRERRELAESLLAVGFPELAGELLDDCATDARDPLELGLAKAAQGAALVAEGKSAQAESVLRAALATLERPLPGDDPLERRRLARAGRARALVAQGDAIRLTRADKEGARSRYEAAARADPSSPVARVRLAELALARGDFPRARGDIDIALVAAPRSPEVLCALAEIALAERDTSGVLAQLESVLAELGEDGDPARRADLLLES
ncbi:protein kinase, partial [bacterium]|nr:protein kinase [bacterium]